MVTAGRRIAAKQAKQPVGEDGPGRPGLLAVEDILIAVAGGLAGNRGHVRAGIGLRPALRPHVGTGRHARQEPLLLRLGAELHQGRPEQQLAVLIDAHRPIGAVVLLFEDQPLDQVATAAAELGWPHHHRQAAFEQLGFPGTVLLEAFTGVVVGQWLTRQVGRKPGADFLAEGFLFGGIG
ncbi:hypothetical protein D3C85_1244590 [compost metagenome]